MNLEEFVKQQVSLGYSIHYHRGVWWQEVTKFYCKPVWPFQVIPMKASYPKYTRCLLGFSYIIPEGQKANKIWHVFSIEGEKLKNYSIKSLSSSKRARVRKGFRNTEIKRITKIEDVIEDMKVIAIETAKRTGYGHPPIYYVRKFEEWKNFIFKLFNLPDREWWGAFVNGRLVAYIYAHEVDGIAVISAAKSHTDYLKLCPNDALIFNFVEYCRDKLSCNEVIFGEWDPQNPSLNRFKEKLGFMRKDLPMYAWYNPLVKLIKKIKE